MSKQKRNKAKFWCHQCGLIGYRNPADAQAKAKELGKGVRECSFGWHVS